MRSAALWNIAISELRYSDDSVVFKVIVRDEYRGQRGEGRGPSVEIAYTNATEKLNPQPPPLL